MISHPVHGLRPKKRGDTLAAAEFNRVVSAVQAALRRRMPRGFASNDFFLERQQPRLELQAFPGEVYAAQPYAPNRALYALREVVWNRDVDDWGVKPGGRTTRVTGDDFALPAVNGCEAGNDGTGIEVVGVDFDAEPLASSTFEVIEIKNCPVVAVFPMPRASLGTGIVNLGGPTPPGPADTAFWFSIPNAIDGGCPPTPASASNGGTGSCSCSSCCLSASAVGAGLAVLDNGQIIVRLGPGLMYSGNDVAVRTSGMVYATDAGGVALHPPRLDAYDATGGQNIIAPATVTLDTLRVSEPAPNEDPRDKAFVWTDSDEIELKASGRLVVDYRLSVSMGTGTHEGKCFLERDDGTGYAVVPGTDAFLGKRATGTTTRSVSGHVVFDVAPGHLVRLRADRISGLIALTTVADGSALSALLERN